MAHVLLSVRNGTVNRGKVSASEGLSLAMRLIKPYAVPISVQVGVVAALFVAALIALWTTGASVVARAPSLRGEGDSRPRGRRARRPGTRHHRQGRGVSQLSGTAVARCNSMTSSRTQAAAVLSRDRGIEGGYLVLRLKSFLGTVRFGDGPRQKRADNEAHGVTTRDHGRGDASLPPWRLT